MVRIWYVTNCVIKLYSFLFFPHRREFHVREVLQRYCRVNEDDSIELTDEEVLMVDKFRVPVEWIHEAKALHAKYAKEHYKEAMLLIRACQWNRAHQVILEHLAADSIIEGNIFSRRRIYTPINPNVACGSVRVNQGRMT